MLVDWFTVGAQAVNFVVLLWLLKRFLYKPVLDAIDAREQRIALALADAEAIKAEASRERRAFEEKNEAFDRQRETLLRKATDEAASERRRLVEEARAAADTLSATRQERLRKDAHSLNQAIAGRVQQEVFAIARKTLSDLATASLEERLSEVFTRRLRAMSVEAKAVLAHALETASEPAVLRSAFDLLPEQRASIQNALNETFSAEVRVCFETAPDIVGGIELAANGQKISWSIADYLASLERGVGELLQNDDQPETDVAPKPRADAETGPDSA